MSLSPSAQRVQDALIELGTQIQVRELPASTRTAAEAAQAVGCALGQIVKSLVFRGVQSGQAILVETSGANRVSEARLAGHLGEEVRMASAEFVRMQYRLRHRRCPSTGACERAAHVHRSGPDGL